MDFKPRPWWDKSQKDIEELINSKPYRYFVTRDINPEFTRLMGGLLGLENQTRKGLLDFNIEIPGYNSNRFYMGMDWRL